MPSTLYLIPNFLSDGPSRAVSFPVAAIAKIRCFMVENEKSARRLLKEIDPHFPIQECTFFELSEHTKPNEAREFFNENKGNDVGIISEAGVPCVADPGADMVRLAHANRMEVMPLVGPSSIILALMASGLNGQSFAFSGYLPKDKTERIKKIKELEKRSKSEKQTQIFMETPYRNGQLLEEVCFACDPRTLLCVAADLTGAQQYIKTLPVKDWPKENPALDKRPALFLICSA